ncbi:hypothetical protein WR25_03345 isoform D [Diploscapter pachys]|nr:hypothetical protein WR25_03345 isoform C [Diploscapter pachys]PAV80785.1 hypothetical protein WR25_03345 isoform D [Diploscapter pachys]
MDFCRRRNKQPIPRVAAVSSFRVALEMLINDFELKDMLLSDDGAYLMTSDYYYGAPADQEQQQRVEEIRRRSPNTVSRDPHEPRDSYRQYDTRNQGYSEESRDRDNSQSHLPRHDERSLTSPSSFKRGQPSRNAYAESKNDYYGRRAGNTYASDNNWRPNDNHSDARAESREVVTPTRNRREAALFGYKKFGAPTPQIDAQFQTDYNQVINGRPEACRNMVHLEIGRNRSTQQNPAVINNRTESFSSTENEMEGYRTPPSSTSGFNSPVEKRLRTLEESPRRVNSNSSNMPATTGRQPSPTSLSSLSKSTERKKAYSQKYQEFFEALISLAPHCDVEMCSIKKETPLLSQIWEDLQDADKVEELLDNYNNKANSLAFGGSQLNWELLKAFNALITSKVEFDKLDSEVSKNNRMKVAKQLATELYSADYRQNLEVAICTVKTIYRKHGPVELKEYNDLIKTEIGHLYNHGIPECLSVEQLLKHGLLATMVTQPLGKLVPTKFLEFVTLVTVRSNSLEAVILDLLEQDGEMSLEKLFEIATDESRNNPFNCVRDFDNLPVEERRDSVMDVIYAPDQKIFAISSGKIRVKTEHALILNL